MLNDTTKRKINSLRQILVGKVPDPKSQVDQITNALIYKYMDDMDRQAEAFGGKAAFFVGEYEQYSWRKLMDPKLGGQERMNLYVEALEKMSGNKNLSPIFRQILRGAFLPYRSPETLNLFLTEINSFTYEHSEELGNAYEYLLSIMGAQGDAGQFRTPRHIIDFIVEVVDPKKDDSILDPACGTAGFLISAYKHIIGNHDGKDNETGKPTKEEKELSPKEMKELHKNFVGYDISPEMGKLSRVNMFLHSFPEPKIFEYDTLSDDSRWEDKFDVILANPPFMSPKGGIIPHKRFSIPATRAEVLFVDYIMEHLKPKGRAGIIVPEGIIFQSGNAYKQLRKKLVEDGLFAVVSLPSGVFNPYAGVKTSVLLFDNEVAKRSKGILFVKIDSDGYDLGAQRRPIDKNDLPRAIGILKEWRKHLAIPSEVEGSLAIAVAKERISESGDYNLSIDRYRVATDYTNANWPMVKLSQICEIQNGLWTGKKPPFVRAKVLRNTNFIKKTGLLSFGDIAELDVEERHLVKRELINGDIILENSGGSPTQPVGRVAYFDSNDSGYSYSNFTSRIRVTETSLVNPKYLWALLVDLYQRGNTERMQSHTSGIKNLDKESYLSSKIPLPPLEIQEQIVAELDGYASIIAGAKQIVKNWKPKIDIDPAWPKVKLGEVCAIKTGKKDVNEGNPEGEYPFFTCAKEPTHSDGYSFDTEALLIAGNGDVGAVKYYKGKFEAYQRTYVLDSFKEKAFPIFLYYYLDGMLKPVVSAQKLGNTMPYIKMGMLSEFEIPLPSLEIQKQIVEKIEAERALVESAKKLIEIYEQKSKETIAKLWN